MNNPILLDVISAVSSKWHRLGLRLGQTEAELSSYRAGSMLDEHTCCVKVFSHWIDNSGCPPHYPLSWDGMYEVLVAIGHRGTADDMMKNLRVTE